MSLEQFTAIVVGAVNYGDADKILRLLSPAHGRVSVLAKRARSSNRRYGGALESGNEVEITAKRGRGDLWFLQSAEPLRLPRHARADLERLALLAYGCEVCSSLAPETSPAPKLFRLLQVLLEVLETQDATPGLRQALEAKALTFAGMAPSLLWCAACGEQIDAEVGWNHEAGGALHRRCGAASRVVDARQLPRLEALRRTPLAEVRALPPGPPGVLADFIAHQLSRPLKSRTMADEVVGG